VHNRVAVGVVAELSEWSIFPVIVTSAILFLELWCVKPLVKYDVRYLFNASIIVLVWRVHHCRFNL
jgi:hypothetical protein